MKKILLFLAFAGWLFAVDATISVINKGLALPKIVLQDATTAVGDQAFKGKFHKIMLGDLKVSSNFKIGTTRPLCSTSSLSMEDNVDIL